MGQQLINIDSEINAPVSDVFALFSDHEKFGKILGTKMKRIHGGKESLNGLGSIRSISIPPFPEFEETITDFKDNELIEYKITKGGPIKNHTGTIRFTENDGKTLVNYQIVFEPKIPFTGGIIKFALQDGISRGIGKYAKKTAA